MNKTHSFCETLLTQPNPLKLLGWKPFFQQQLTLDDYEDTLFARVIAHHRSGYVVVSEQGETHLPIQASLPSMTVGDWVILNHQQQFSRLLERRSLFSRKAAGSKVAEQLIAANVDTVFIVCSVNHDFNLSRIERYLTLVNEADVEPVIVLTKADLCDDVDELKTQVQRLDPLLMVESVNGLDESSVSKLMSWCGEGQTVAFIGSSGVGKSTLVNTLLGEQEQETGGIREDDSKGRHTTTSRSIHLLPSGGVLMDTPGMREIQLTDCEAGVSETFSDIEALAEQCRFGDCQHQTEPGCAVQAAIEDGTLEMRRFTNYQKLLREQAHNGATLAKKRAQSKQFGKMVRNVVGEKRKRQQGY
ncbi:MULTISPECIES: ribosome small subunit-dependent GTPase A [Vibrio]|jgi:ribosome biogenesis GTPase|uniref:ribosome small subunit-dependent GTPase A n=1 Tax=Vibrio TaxID=662 RepID=UPI0005AF1B3D|nr:MULTISPECIES: ribosome small subunit-dependent GTPase A [Vibrio]KIP76088.1 GTPase RsgA [Vibrio harveyi]MCF6453101.1 ribosome small subunit-dependent GTPase A [Vibrio sp. MMG023]MCX2791427.1 ribosome small subunit-dependent GTPase A [Vibrio sp. Sgm 5]NOJ18416.1 ribosome small subunit-dependent GTPase A [Vibrio jasicida]PQJ70696.1 ribosome small subunit-dependent GTPase A [Vibrio jasicida]